MAKSLLSLMIRLIRKVSGRLRRLNELTRLIVNGLTRGLASVCGVFSLDRFKLNHN
jgi:hypothetical protein